MRLNLGRAIHKCGMLGCCLMVMWLSGCASMHRGPAAHVDIFATQLGQTMTEGMAEGIAAGDGGDDSQGHGFFHTVLFYIPNRVFDLFDIVRLRLHVGPGIGIGARATEVLDAYLGSYASIYVGLPGPRMRPMPKLPFGVETFSGVEVSVADATVTGGMGPGYSPSEFGANIFLLLIGADVGLDPIELLDFVTGFILVPIRNDEM